VAPALQWGNSILAELVDFCVAPAHRYCNITVVQPVDSYAAPAHRYGLCIDAEPVDFLWLRLINEVIDKKKFPSFYLNICLPI
jgi:hypothetical protein